MTKIRTILLIMIVMLFGLAELKAREPFNQDFISALDSIHCLSEDAFNERSYKEAMSYEIVISKLIPNNPSFLQRVVANRSDMFLYAAQFQPIDSVWKYSNKLLNELIEHETTDIPEFHTLQLRTLYFNSLREEGERNDSIAELATSKIKQAYGEYSIEYANALLLKSVILIRSIPSTLEVDYKVQRKIRHEKIKGAKKSINQAISIYKSRKISFEYTWPSYALALKETISFEKLWRWHNKVIRHYEDAVEEYGIASNVRNGACAQTNSIFRSIINAPDGSGIPDAINALDNLVEIHSAVHGHTSIEARFLFLASALSNFINDIQGARIFFDRSMAVSNNCTPESVLNDSIFINLLNDINTNKIRLTQSYDKQPLKGFEEALLTIGSPNYDKMKYIKDQDDEYWFAPTFDSSERELNYPNLIRELMTIFSGSPFLDKDFLSRFGLSRIKEERWNYFIDYPESKGSYIYPVHGEEIYYFDDLNQAIGSPLVDVYNKLDRKKNKSSEDYQNLSRCCFYLYDFEKAAAYQQTALETLISSGSQDGNLIMEYHKRKIYLLMLDFWYDLWLYSDASRLASKHNAALDNKMSKRANYLQKHPDAIYKKLNGLIISAQSFSYEAIPYLYNILPNIGNEQRLLLWKDFSAWFYTVMPMLAFTPGMEEVIYDIQLFSKGLLLETSKTSKPRQYRWTDIRDALHSSEIAIEFVKSGEGYCAALIKSDSKRPQIIPLFTQTEYNALTDKEDLYLSSAGYDLIISPLELSDSISTIYFSPTGIINTVAIESFYDTSGVLASDKWNFVRLSTTKELIKDNRSYNSKHIALYGGLDYNRRSYKSEFSGYSVSNRISERKQSRYIAPENLRYGVDSLRWSLPEVTTISNIYQDRYPFAEIFLYTSDAGVEESLHILEHKKPNIIHFATHGYYWTPDEREKRGYVSFVERANIESDDPTEQAMLYSGLFLSGANQGLRGYALPVDEEDGILTSKELSGMDFSETDFVALSACQTGLGELNGEGVFGLQRGFKLAGVRSLLMSLWPVHDKATNLLMIEFYRNMISGDTKYSALNKAKKYIQKYADEEDEFSDPEYWAGWILLDALD